MLTQGFRSQKLSDYNPAGVQVLVPEIVEQFKSWWMFQRVARIP